LQLQVPNRSPMAHLRLLPCLFSGGGGHQDHDELCLVRLDVSCCKLMFEQLLPAHRLQRLLRAPRLFPRQFWRHPSPSRWQVAHPVWRRTLASPVGYWLLASVTTSTHHEPTFCSTNRPGQANCRLPVCNSSILGEPETSRLHRLAPNDLVRRRHVRLHQGLLKRDMRNCRDAEFHRNTPCGDNVGMR
jgi:hypothetical protein